MKRIQFLLIPLICCAMVPGDQSTCPAIVNNQSGVATYIYCLPDRAYDTVCTFTTDIGLNSYPGPSIPNRVIGFDRPIDALVRKAVRKENKGPKKKRKDISAIISFDTRKAVAVHFTTQVKESQVSKARVQQYRGYYIFVRSKPAIPYEPVSKVKLNSEIDLTFTGYADMNTLLDSLIGRHEKAGHAVQANALMTTTGLEAEFIHINH